MGGCRTPHDVAWLALESGKPNRAPHGASLLVAQMSAGWTEAHYDDDRVDIVDRARARIEALVGPLPQRLWTDTQRWRYSLPDAAVDAAALRDAEARGLFAAGDAVAGTGRVHQDQVEVARQRLETGGDLFTRGGRITGKGHARQGGEAFLISGEIRVDLGAAL